MHVVIGWLVLFGDGALIGYVWIAFADNLRDEWKIAVNLYILHKYYCLRSYEMHNILCMWIFCIGKEANIWTMYMWNSRSAMTY